MAYVRTPKPAPRPSAPESAKEQAGAADRSGTAPESAHADPATWHAIQRAASLSHTIAKVATHAPLVTQRVAFKAGGGSFDSDEMAQSESQIWAMCRALKFDPNGKGIPNELLAVNDAIVAEIVKAEKALKALGIDDNQTMEKIAEDVAALKPSKTKELAQLQLRDLTRLVSFGDFLGDVVTGKRESPDIEYQRLVAAEIAEAAKVQARNADEKSFVKDDKRPDKAALLKEAEELKKTQAKKLEADKQTIKDQQEREKQRLSWVPDAATAWLEIQAGQGQEFGDQMISLLNGNFIRLSAPHRWFLSKYERVGQQPYGQRDANKFGESRVIVLDQLVVAEIAKRNAAVGPDLVTHAHCDAGGTALSVGIKFRAAEQLPGDNLTIAAKWLPFFDSSRKGTDNLQFT